MDTIIIGCGFAGASMARLLADSGQRVKIIERRDHIGGNCYDAYDEHGILVHVYGPHIFHTNDQKVYEFLSRFTDWYAYRHEVVGNIYGKLVPIPFNLHSLNVVYEKEKAQRIRRALLAAYGEGARVSILELRKHEDAEIREVAAYVYENIFLKYTMKQWNQKPEEVDESVMARVPIVISEDDRYFQDRWQGMPAQGYTKLFERMLEHPLIEVALHTDARDVLRFDFAKKTIFVDGKEFKGNVIFSGAVDELFDHQLGRLPYRSLRFAFEHHEQEYYQSKGVVNYTVSEEFTRITEFKRLSGQKASSTTIVKEYPQSYEHEGQQPYYAILTEENIMLHQRYAAMLSCFPNFYLLGRLAQYRYYNMDAIVAEALRLAEELKG